MQEKIIEGNISSYRYLPKLKLGEGSYGQVHLAYDINNHKQFALKIQPTEDFQNCEREKNILNMLMNKRKSLKNIVQIFDFFEHQNEDNETILCTIMELGEGNFRQYWSRKQCIANMRMQLSLSYQIINGVNEIHQMGLQHRDIKPENILYFIDEQKNVTLKICDIGSARIDNNDYKTQNVGTIQYLAPETKFRQYDKKVDIWSLGLIMYEIFSLKSFFIIEFNSTLLNYPNQQEIDEIVNKLKIESEIKKLLKQVIVIEPANRLSSQQILEKIVYLIDRQQDKEKKNQSYLVDCSFSDDLRIVDHLIPQGQQLVQSRKNSIKLPSLRNLKQGDTFVRQSNQNILRNSDVIKTNQGFGLETIRPFRQSSKLFDEESISFNSQIKEELEQTQRLIRNSTESFNSSYISQKPQLENSSDYRGSYYDEMSKGILSRKGQNLQKNICFDNAANNNQAEQYYQQGIRLINNESYLYAIDQLNQAIELNPNSANFYYNKGLCLHKIKNFEEAIKFIDLAININPKDDKYHFLKGLSLGSMKNFIEAIDSYNVAIKICSNKAEYHHNKGVNLARLQSYEKSIECYEIAIQLNPRDADFYNSKGLLTLYVFWVNLRMHQKIMRMQFSLIRIMQRSHNSKGICLRKIGQEEQANKSYDIAIKINPHNSKYYYNKGISLYELGRYEEGLYCFDKAIIINPQEPDYQTKKDICLKELMNCQKPIQFDDSITIKQIQVKNSQKRKQTDNLIFKSVSKPNIMYQQQ